MLFVVMYNMPTLNKIYLLTYLLTLLTFYYGPWLQPYLKLEAGDNISEIQVARLGTEPETSCSASLERNHSATATPCSFINCVKKK